MRKNLMAVTLVFVAASIVVSSGFRAAPSAPSKRKPSNRPRKKWRKRVCG